MQLNEHRSLRKALAAATCSLLGLASGTAMAASDPVQTDSAVFYYTEKNRVNVAETAAIMTIPLANEETLTISPTVDVISGASPNGATPTNKTQTFGSSITAADQLPLQALTDIRLALAVEWQYPVDRLSRTNLGANVSSEKDYDSFGANYSHMWDFNNKLTTFTIGLSGSRDTITPSTGVVNKGLMSTHSASTLNSRILQAQTITRASGGSSSNTSSNNASHPSRDKKVIDGLIGLTQVINRRTLMQLNYSIGSTNGYLTDPYKILSLVDPDSGETQGYLNEQRPTNRLRQTIFWETVFHLPHDVIHLSYRRYWDDWKIKSDTVELNYHLKLGGDSYFEPMLRYYNQSAANFYHYHLVSGEILPENASADFRLAALKSYSYGLKFAVPLSDTGEISINAMLMQQIGDSKPNDAIGIERTQNLSPGLDAMSIQFNLSYKI